ncbi:hypothetical protein ACFPA1_08090 [Neobacillus sp. GCM10023253]|uniref:hypothetical protein n=1 Tax=Neobacillus sp. GCM10023253 TaxID=3252644 RepID=UPI003618887C
MDEESKEKKSKSLWRTLLAAPLLFFLPPLSIGLYLTHPFPAKTTKSPKDYGMVFEEIEFHSRKDKVKLAGGFLQLQSKAKKQSLLHTVI